MTREGTAGRTAGLRRSLAAYAELVRVPNLFTAPPDVILGAALAAGAGAAVPLGAVAAVGGASMLLYAGGTTLNDYFDRAEDARDRPDRPLPSGRVPERRALAVGVGLLVGGVAVAWAAAGATAGAAAAALAAAIALYDGLIKGSVAGFLTMGSCRGLNVVLGATAAGSSIPGSTGPAVAGIPAEALAVAAVVVAYVAGVTSMAESETGSTDRGPVLVGVAAVAVAAAGVVGLWAVRSPSIPESLLAGAFLAAFLGWTGRALRAAYADPGPGTIGPAVGACVLGLIPLDAAFAATVGPRWALAAAAFVLPAVGLARTFDVS